MKSTYEDFQRVLDRSKEYWFEGSVLAIRDYQTGKTVKIDLGGVSEETFEEIVWEDEDEEEEW